MRTPKVSIGMPVYNGEKFLKEALVSLLTQSYSDFELIVSDNASTDGTEKIARDFAAKDARIRYFRQPKNLGAGPNFRLVLSLARGEYFKWACADDMHYPDNLARTLEVLSAAPPEVVLVTPRVSLIDEKGLSLMDENGIPLPRAGLGPGDKGPERISTTAKTPHRRLAEILPQLEWSVAQFGLFRTSAVRLTRGIDSFFASDRVLLAEVAMLGQILEIDEPLFARRQHAEISTALHKNAGDYALWMDPTIKGRAAKRRPIMSLEYARSIRRLPLTPSERVLCFGVIAQVWFKQKIRRLLRLKRK
jgi:glycosyltransferase involved in cell wall biosynthesis